MAKLFTGDIRSDIGSEAEKMKYANTINGLVVKFICLDVDEVLQAEILVMERIYPFDFRAYEVEKRELWIDVFEDDLKQLYNNGFVHRDQKRLSGLDGLYFDNIFLTRNGLRLIDVGISALKSQVSNKIFDKYVETELKEMKVFREYFLNR